MFISLGSGAAARGLPVFLPYTEATADANTFVCEFTGGSSANETGVGGGLTGANLVLTQLNGVAGASGGLRQITAPNQGFSCPAAALLEFTNLAEFTILWLLNTWAAVSGGYVAFCQSAPATYRSTLFNYESVAGGSPLFRAQNATDGFYPNMGVPGAHPTTGDVWVGAWKKSGNLHWGFKAGSVPPTGWDDIPAAQRQVAIGGGNFAGADWATLCNIIGDTSAGGTFKIGRLVMSKLGLQSAPI